jgi:predicted secreted Zn-dependent protease
LLAIRNEGLVVPCNNRSADCILLGDMVLSKVEQVISYDLSGSSESHIYSSIIDDSLESGLVHII